MPKRRPIPPATGSGHRDPSAIPTGTSASQPASPPPAWPQRRPGTAWRSFLSRYSVAATPPDPGS